MKALKVLGLVGFVLGVSGCSTPAPVQQKALGPSVEEQMLQSARSVEKTLNDLVLLEKGAETPASESRLMDSTVASAVTTPVKMGLPPVKTAAVPVASPLPSIPPVASSVVELNSNPARQASNPEQIWASKVKLYWRNDIPGFIKIVASTLNYKVKVQGVERAWPEIRIDSTDSTLQTIWSDFSHQVQSMAQLEVSDMDHLIVITYKPFDLSSEAEVEK